MRFNCTEDLILLYFFKVMKAPTKVTFQTQANKVFLHWNPPEEGGGAKQVKQYGVRWSSSSSSSWLQTRDTLATIPKLQSSTRYTITLYANIATNEASLLSVLTSKYLFQSFKIHCNTFHPQYS